VAHHPVTHFEFMAKDSKKLQSFYAGVFGWKLNDAPEGYKMVDTNSDGHGIGGGISQARGEGKSGLTIYVETEDLRGTLAAIEKAGGKTIMPPQQAGPVEVALFADPDGNVVGLAKGM